MACEDGKESDRANRRIGHLQDKLDLSDGQFETLQNIFSKAKEKHNCRELDSSSEKKECRKAFKEDVKDQIADILSEEQQEKFTELKDQRKSKRRFRRKNRQDRFQSDE